MTLTLKQVAGRWQALVSVASTAVATATAVFQPPPVGDARGLLALGALLAAIASGLTYVAMLRNSTRRQLPRWIAAAAIATASALACHYLYARLWDSRVATYGGEQHIVGDVLTADGEAWVRKEGVSSPSQLLFDAGGVAERIWTADSIARVRTTMRVTYYASFPAVAVAILATVQSMHCARVRARRRKPKVAGAAARS